jgi:uncharacterized membrane protein YhiD involved in acid resistance
MDALSNAIGATWSFSDPVLMDAAYSLVLAFVLGQAAAWMYVYTHTGLSYSRAFVQSIVVLTVVLSLGMMVIGNNIAIAFGLIGALSVIRFRNILKDTRDTAFIFFTLVSGLATGTGRHGLAVLGTAVFLFVVLYLHWTQFGSRDTSDAFLRFRLAPGGEGGAPVQTLLSRYCRRSTLVSERFAEAGDGEIAYRLVLRNPRRASDLMNELRAVGGVSQVSFVLHEEQSEV